MSKVSRLDVLQAVIFTALYTHLVGNGWDIVIGLAIGTALWTALAMSLDRRKAKSEQVTH